MAVTDAQRRMAVVDHNRKLRLEAQFRPKLRRFHRRLVRSYAGELARDGTIFDFETETQDDLRELLLAHYVRVGELFTRVIDAQLKQVSIVVSEHYKVKSVEQARAITTTTRRHAERALTIARLAATEAGLAGLVIMTGLEIATAAVGIFNRRLAGREDSLLMFETNLSAEAAKLTQVELLAGEEPSIAGGSSRPSKRTKSWANLGDSRVRRSPFNHLFAEQTVPANKPFIVSGERLMYPGDTSLGASLGNVIRCRCSAIYERAAA